MTWTCWSFGPAETTIAVKIADRPKTARASRTWAMRVPVIVAEPSSRTRPPAGGLARWTGFASGDRADSPRLEYAPGLQLVTRPPPYPSMAGGERQRIADW